MFYVFLLICGALGLVLYLVVMMNLVPGAAAERIGVLEPLPSDVGKWKEDAESDAGKFMSDAATAYAALALSQPR